MSLLENLLRAAVLVSLVATSMHAETAMSAATKGRECAAEFELLTKDPKYRELTARTVRWEALESKCAGDGQYELRLGALYALAKRDEEAREVFERGLRLKSEYAKDIRLALFDLDLRAGQLVDAERGAVELAAEYPQWREGHRALGQVRLVQGRFDDSVAELEAANAIEATGGSYTLLAIGYYKLHRYRESALSMQRALKLDRSTLAHTPAIVSAAYSLVALGHLSEADDLLKKHKEVQPDASQDASYVEAVKRIEAAVAQQNK